MNVKAAIFDMDGVIFDTERLAYESWKAIERKYGFKPIEPAYMQCIGTTRTRTREIFLEYYGEDFPYDTYLPERNEIFMQEIKDKSVPLKEGVRELLSYLKNEGYYIAIASSTYSERVRFLVEQAKIQQYFDRIVGGDMVSHSKPDPEIFLKAAQGLDTPLGEILVFEDSFNGIRAAKNAGMFPVMVPDMLAPDEEMKEKAGIILPSLLSVIDYLKK